MQSDNDWALKEWAVICRALAAGRQCVLLRKGGIAEPNGVFRVEHPEFWLLQTHFHEDPSQLSSEAGAFVARSGAADCGADRTQSSARLTISSYAVVTAVWKIADERQLQPLAPFHIWSEEAILRRFHYREPGLFVICARVHNRVDTLRIADTPEIAGCRSWVELPNPLSTDVLTPALDEAAFAAATRKIAGALAR